MRRAHHLSAQENGRTSDVVFFLGHDIVQWTAQQVYTCVAQFLMLLCGGGPAVLLAGATACVALVRGNQLCVASVGDSR